MKQFRSLFLLPVIFLAGCSSKDEHKNMLVKNWTLVGFAGQGAIKIPDSVKQAEFGKRFMEFTNDGRMIATGGMSMKHEGNYTLSADGKQLFTTVRGRISDSLGIDKLTDDTLVLSFKRDTIQWIMVRRR